MTGDINEILKFLSGQAGVVALLVMVLRRAWAKEDAVETARNAERAAWQVALQLERDKHDRMIDRLSGAAAAPKGA